MLQVEDRTLMAMQLYLRHLQTLLVIQTLLAMQQVEDMMHGTCGTKNQYL